MTMMQSSLWYNHFSGAMYPISLNKCTQAGQGREVKPLLSLVAAYIVQDSSLTLEAVSILPQDLSEPLMQQALEKSRDRAVDVLLSKWPISTLSLKKLAPDLFTSLQVLYDQNKLVSVVKHGLRLTTTVAHNFMETLKKKTITKLKYIDMTGYPTAEVIVFYLASHCMLAHNEQRQNRMIHTYEAAVKRLKELESREGIAHFTADHTLPDGSFVLKLDAFVTSEGTLFELCKALKVSSFTNSQLRLVVEKLDATCLGQPKIELLLEQLDVQTLQGLRLKYNSLNTDDFQKLAPLIEKFVHLTALDLSCNCINMFHSDAACEAMARVLANLPSLVRLDLSNNRVKSKLRRILDSLGHPLQYLRLVGCGLTVADVTYLSESSHVTSLQELSLSENSLGLAVNSLIRLLKGAHSTLCVLELDETGLTDSHFDSLIDWSAFTQLERLLLLNFSGNKLSLDMLSRLCQNVCQVQGLQYVCTSYPQNCYEDLSDEASDAMKKGCSQYLKAVMFEERATRHLDCETPYLITMELEQDLQQQ